jgi:DNA-binding transcriptional ArsR family regulator
MKYLLILIFSVNFNLFATELDAKTLLGSIDRSQLSIEQQKLYDRALQQEHTEVIQLTDKDLVEAERQLEKNVLYKLKVRHIKRWLKTADHSTTCLDEYLQQRKKQIKLPVVLLIDTGLGVALAAASGGWVPTITVSFAFIRYFLSETIAGRIMRLRYPDAIPGSWNPYEFDAIANGISAVTLIPYYIAGVTSAVKAVNTSFMMKAIANTKGFHSKHIYKLRKKYLKCYPEDSEIASIERLKEVISEADTTGVLCDGSIVKEYAPRRYRRGRKLKQRLTRKKELFQYLHDQL